jgi:hypothetical protein
MTTAELWFRHPMNILELSDFGIGTVASAGAFNCNRFSFIFISLYQRPADLSAHHHLRRQSRLALHKPDSGDSCVFGPGHLTCFLEAFRIETFSSQALQELGAKPAGRTENAELRIAGLKLVWLFTGGELLPCFFDVY